MSLLCKWIYKYGQKKNNQVLWSILKKTNLGEVHTLLDYEPMKNTRIIKKELPPDLEVLDLENDENRWLIDFWLEEYQETWASHWFDTYDDLFIKSTGESCNDLMLGGKGVNVPYDNLLNNLKELIPKDWWKAGIFIRLDSVSPKDICLTELYSPEKCVEIINKSNRCQKSLRGIFKDIPNRQCYVRPYVNETFDEIRCSIYNDRLCSISIESKLFPNLDYVELVKTWFKKYNKILPYETCIIDLAIFEGGNIKIIEFNSFGINMGSGINNINWDTLYFLIELEPELLPLVVED